MTARCFVMMIASLAMDVTAAIIMDVIATIIMDVTATIVMDVIAAIVMDVAAAIAMDMPTATRTCVFVRFAHSSIPSKSIYLWMSFFFNQFEGGFFKPCPRGCTQSASKHRSSKCSQ